ncbi:MAG: hypothetical protein K6B14_08525 [Lachnospiraceae bacterium]|nr:hypothetical protein [Lachnospiraceae bacterium]
MFEKDDKVKKMAEETKKVEENKADEFELNDADLDQAAGGIHFNRNFGDSEHKVRI